MNDETDMNRERMKMIKTENPKENMEHVTKSIKGKEKEKGRKGGYTGHHTPLNSGVICKTLKTVVTIYLTVQSTKFFPIAIQHRKINNYLM